MAAKIQDVIAPQTHVLSRACAKINLNLHITGRLSNGYHNLYSLVAFAGCHDTLELTTLENANHDNFSITYSGTRALELNALSQPTENLVIKAAQQFIIHAPNDVKPIRAGHFHLIKRLPLGGGIGGGSSDAAAALRLLAKAHHISVDHPAIILAAQSTGADVPVCLTSKTCFMSGIGDVLSAPVTLPRLFAVLVTPPIHISTPQVFQHFKDRECAFSSYTASPTYFTAVVELIEYLQHTHNDLTPSAVAIAPIIETVLTAIRQTPDCQIARMSGSGGTCFGLYETCSKAANATKILKRHFPAAWIKSTILK
jgi:4-diphosphocytidyl-2-C-methyl-D-erythritol kinase